MGHALRETWRVARSMVLDIRPAAEAPQVWVRDRAGRESLCGGLLWKGGEVHLHRAANEAVRQVLAESLFAVKAARQFDWVDAYENTDELIEDIADEWDNWGLDEDVSLRLVQTMERAGKGASPFVRQSIQAQLLQKLG